MHHQRTAKAQHAESFGQLFHQIGRVDADHLGRSVRRIGQRTEQIKDRAQAQFAAGGLNVFHGGMHGRGEEKRNADLLQTSGQSAPEAV